VNQPYRQQGSQIDWQAIGKRLLEASVATEEALQPSPERARRILDERASKLARPSVDPHSARNTTDVISFALDGEQFCIETRCVREVRRFGEVTPLPGVPDFLVGVTNLRGEILPLIDVRCFLELPSKGPVVASHVIICGDARAEFGIIADTIHFGIIADTIHDVSGVDLDELAPNPIGHSERSRDCVLGIARNATVVLNGFALLTDRRLFVGETSTATTVNTGGDS
jgi:purine-binding chemotaxis protein CheW